MYILNSCIQTHRFEYFMSGHPNMEPHPGTAYLLRKRSATGPISTPLGAARTSIAPMALITAMPATFCAGLSTTLAATLGSTFAAAFHASRRSTISTTGAVR